MAAPFGVRREALVTLYEQFPIPELLLSEGISRYGSKLFAQIVRHDLEGMMAKRLDAPYLPGKRSRYWLKIKPTQSKPALADAHANRTDARGASSSNITHDFISNSSSTDYA